MFKSVLLPLLLMGIGGGVVFLYTMPMYEDVKALQREKSSYEQALTQADEILQRKTELQDQYNSFSSEDRQRVQTLIPDNVEPIDIIIETEAIAQNGGGVVVSDISAEAAEDSQSSGAAVSSEPYSTISSSYTVAADYHNFLNFLRDVELNLRLTDVDSIEFSSDTESGLMQFSINASTYQLNE